MYCPRCRAEYRKGFTECSDCHVQLVHELPEEPQDKYVEYKELLRTFNPIDISILKSILDGEDITYYFHGEHFSYVRPLLEPARLMVATDQYDRAAEIIEDLDLAITFSSGTPRKRKGEGNE